MDISCCHIYLTCQQDIIPGKRSGPGFSIGSTCSAIASVLGNMLKNALEASEPGDEVSLGCRRSAEGAFQVEFWVHNPGYMERAVQMQIFQRSFSTKGEGRGLGSYSMKLLGERYLQGQVGFTSEPETGTIFYLRLPSQPTE